MALQTSLFDIDNWREIGATLARNKTRTFLTAFGIFWGTMMLALLWGGSNGLEGLLMRNFSSIASTNMGGFFPNRTSIAYHGFNKGRYWNLNQTDVDNLRSRADGIEFVTGVYQSYGNMTYADKSQTGSIMGVEPDYARISAPKILAGRFVNESDLANSRKVTFVGSKVAETLMPGVSYSEMLGKEISLRGVYYKIVGIGAQVGDASIGGRVDDCSYIPLTTMRQVESGAGDRVDFVAFSMRPGHKVSDVIPVARRLIYSRHSVHPSDEEALQVMDISELFDMVSNVFLGLTVLALFVGIGSLMAGIIGVGNIMWIIVKERTHEIGIRRAIGATPSSIIVQILSESMVLTTIAGMAGIVVAILALYLVDMGTTDPITGSAGFTLSFGNAMTVLVLFMALGTAAGVIPALKAMRIKPIEAINDK
ncbi:MAG: ABC transporter permease [Pseudoflavonifractor sp.]|nr:ABC transporter permease [Alloprevotella sp.]MCM1116787.1 ABC transporter permease [Pseudoflavonifractor sp.]